MKIRLILCLSALVAGTSGAFAGEVTGRGDVIDPIKTDGRAKSICAFSGLEDLEGAGPGDVQSYGRHPSEGSGVSDDPANNAPRRGGFTPGSRFACNPSEPS